MLNQILQIAIDKKASDVHITTNSEVVYRISAKLVKTNKKLSRTDVEDIAKQLAEDRFPLIERHRQLDLGGTIFGVRYRANIFYERGELAIAIRVINNKIKTIFELNLPPKLLDLVKYNHGLILVTGPTGSGKSTTLAAMIEEINKTSSKHIITLEDPIEYLYENKKSIIHQREIGYDIDSFDAGLKSVLRQDPDVILLGELRDASSLMTALKASETGHMVFATLHTSDVKSTINRLTGMFQIEEAEKVRKLLADSLVAIVSQRLYPMKGGYGAIPAVELMINTIATKNLIRKGEVAQVDTYIQMDQKIGSIPMQKSIEKLLKDGMIEEE